MFSLKLFFLLIVLHFNGTNALMQISEELLEILHEKIHNTEVPAKELYRFTLDVPGRYNRQEIGILLNPGTEKEEPFVVGAFGYMETTIIIFDTCVKQISILYFEDKNGYRPQDRRSTDCLQHVHGHGLIVSMPLLKSLVG